MVSGYAPTDSGSLYYEVAGQGTQLVLIHAGRIDSRMWDEQFRSFSENHRVIRYDIKGYGKSANPTGQFSDAEDLHDLLKHLKVEEACLVGSSNGGSIAIEFALAHPEMVTGLVLAATSISGYEMSPEEIEKRVWEGFSELWKREDELVKQGRLREVVDLEVQTWHSQSPRSAREKLCTLHLENIRAYKVEPWKRHLPPKRPAFKRVGEINVPSLIIIGDLDIPGIQIMNERLHSMLPNSRKLIISGADHILNMSKPDEFNKAVLEFLNSLKHEATSAAKQFHSEHFTKLD